MADSIFLGSADVTTAAAGGLSGSGTIGNPLQVNVDGTTIEVNGSNELTLVANELIADIPSALTSTITLGTPSGTTQTVTVQLKNHAGTNINQSCVFFGYMCPNATGLGEGEGTPNTPGTVTTTGNVCGSNDAGIANNGDFNLISSTSGVVAITIDNNGGESNPYVQRLVICLPDGIVVSDALNVPNA